MRQFVFEREENGHYVNQEAEFSPEVPPTGH